MKTLGVATLVLVLGGSAAAYVFRDHLLPEPQLFTACEAELRARMVPPQTYERVSIDTRIERVSPEVAHGPMPDWGKDDPAFVATWNHGLDYLRAGDPHRITLFISYRTTNAWGMPINSRTACEYVTLRPTRVEDLDVQGWRVRIDGLTAMELAHDRIKRLKDAVAAQ